MSFSRTGTLVVVSVSLVLDKVARSRPHPLHKIATGTKEDSIWLSIAESSYRVNRAISNMEVRVSRQSQPLA